MELYFFVRDYNSEHNEVARMLNHKQVIIFHLSWFLGSGLYVHNFDLCFVSLFKQNLITFNYLNKKSPQILLN